jgi:methyl-accepting chemotaxis protein
MMKNVKIGTRLALGFGITIVLMIVISVIGIDQLAGMNSMAGYLTSEVYPKVDAARRIELYDTDRGRLARTIILAPDQESKSAAKAIFDDDALQIDNQFVLLDNLIRSDEGKNLLRNLKAAHAENAHVLDDIVALAIQDNSLQAMTLLFGKRNKDSYAGYVAAVGAMTNHEETLARNAVAQANRDYSMARVVVVSIVIVVVSVSIMLAWVVSKSIVSPLQAAKEAVDHMATGDFGMQIGHRSRDEVGQLLSGLERMRQSLSSTVDAVHKNAETVSVASSEIASGNTDLSSRTEEQAASLEETAASIVELTETVRHNADNARQANALATNAAMTAETGNDTVHAMVEVISNISHSSVKISDITGLIEGIAFQTNILALNAAVEAARAGDHGRGFAVVASEVRGLAQRSASAAKEIKELIGSSVAMIHEGSKQAGAVQSTMDEIKRAIKQVSDIVGEIAAASEEQRQGIEQINRAVGQMDEVTQQNAALVEQAAAATLSLQEQAKQLKDAVSIFKVENRAAGVFDSASPLESPVRKVTTEPKLAKGAGRLLPNRDVRSTRVTVSTPCGTVATAARSSAIATPGDNVHEQWETF